MNTMWYLHCRLVSLMLSRSNFYCQTAAERVDFLGV
jgi:hypothetical protein